ncbi:hypothetical protein WN944_027775 [Citrus x changshan-huyou]
MEADRLNSPSTSVINLEVLGHQLQFSQDPNSKHLGTTVWDASVVFVKYLEKNCRKGRFCPSKLKGKRVIELGAGCGVAGFGMALLGCNVITTDQIEVLPLLKRNVEWNTSRISQMNPGSDLLGSIQAVELDWGNEDHIKAVAPPFDYIIGTDVLGYEIRSTSVHEEMLQMWKSNFNVKLVPKAKMDSKYQHPSIQLFVMGVDSSVGNTERAAERIDQQNEDGTKETKLEKDENDDNSNPAGKVGDFSGQIMDEDSLLATRLPNGKLSEWETRRYGSMAARLLRDVKIT